MKKVLFMVAILATSTGMGFALSPTLNSVPTEQQASSHRVTGTVVDENGEPLPGAHIMLKGRSIGTITDGSGNFSLNAASGTELVVRYLGYEDQTFTAEPGTKQQIRMTASKIHQLNEIVVKSVKAQKEAPFSKTNIEQEELEEFSKTGRELPMLFTHTPGVVAYGENGLGTGTVYMRIRGAADSRINVTLDGVPLNSPEDQCVFWANMNSYASLLGGAQIQRGVGTSSNGDGAFGGTIALTSKAPDTKPSAEITGSYGSYNTFNVGGSFSTGLFANHWIFDGAYHETSTDGYMHGTSGRSGSYYGGLAYIGDKFVVRLKNFGNFEKTGQAWNGLDTGDLLDWNYGGMGTGLFEYKDFYDAGLGKYNTLYEHLVDGSDPSKGTERYELSDGSLWDKTTDNFWQNRTILSLAWEINDHWTTSGSVHYTHGYGYYKEFRYNNKLSKFGFSNFTLSDGSTLKRTDFVRKKGLSQDFLGLVWNANYKDERWDIIGGLSLQNFWSNHFGYITYIANNEMSNKYLNNGDYQYYDSDADKLDGNIFAKATYHLTDQWDIFADVQYRHVSYSTDGINDKFVSTDNGYVNQRLDIDKKYDFVNPKVGISFHQDGHHAFASFAMSNREPERNNFTDNYNYPAPKAEQLLDTEIGYNYMAKRWAVGANLYWMHYKDQFVQTGELSDIGENLTTNIDKSYRLGMELTAAWTILPGLTIEGNAALSQNKIKDFNEHVENWDDWEGNTDASGKAYDGDGFDVIHYDNSTLAFSPSVILNGFITYRKNGLTATWHTNYVSRQYLDNTECKQRSLPSFSTSDISANYVFNFKNKGIKEMILGFNINNIFDLHYAASGWVYSAIYESGGNPNSNRYTEIGYIPQAGTTVMGNITLRF